MADDSTKALDTAQVLSIIEASARHGVSTLKFRGLEICFRPQAEQGPVSATAQTGPEPTVTTPLTPDAKMSEPKASESKLPSGWDQLELEQKEAYIAELQLTDPQAAEELIERGELIDANDESGDDE